MFKAMTREMLGINTASVATEFQTVLLPDNEGHTSSRQKEQ